MTINPRDIDRFFRDIEERIERATSAYGGYKYKRRNNPYDDYLLEDDEYIYLTVDIKDEPTDIRSYIENGTELIIIIDSGYNRLHLPTEVEKVEKVTCVNGVLDIKIKKYEKEGEGEE